MAKDSYGEQGGGGVFDQAMRDVEPIAPGVERVRARQKDRRRRRRLPDTRTYRFELERWGERVEGLVEGGDRRRLARLARGGFPVELEVDLHGFSAEVARESLLAAVERARREGLRCLLVIHGRGRSSPGGGVLRASVPTWLTAPPAASRVLALATAPPALGGPGALLVLLRRADRGR